MPVSPPREGRENHMDFLGTNAESRTGLSLSGLKQPCHCRTQRCECFRTEHGCHWWPAALWGRSYCCPFTFLQALCCLLVSLNAESVSQSLCRFSKWDFLCILHSWAPPGAQRHPAIRPRSLRLPDCLTWANVPAVTGPPLPARHVHRGRHSSDTLSNTLFLFLGSA